jgi:hypothetical protein
MLRNDEMTEEERARFMARYPERGTARIMARNMLCEEHIRLDTVLAEEIAGLQDHYQHDAPYKTIIHQCALIARAANSLEKC